MNITEIDFSYSYDNSNRLLQALNINQGDNTYSILNTYNKDGNFPAIVGVPKSWRKNFEVRIQWNGNFLVTNNKSFGRGSSVIYHFYFSDFIN